MSRPPRSERLASSKGRPKRRAARIHVFKYQLAANPSRVEENDLKRALQESLLEEQASLANGGFVNQTRGVSKNKINNKNNHINNNNNNNNNKVNHNNINSSNSNNNNRVINSSTNSSDVSKSSNISSSTSLESNGIPLLGTKRTRSSALLDTTTVTPPSYKRAKLTNNSKPKQITKQNNSNFKKKCDNESSVLSEPPVVRPHLSKQIRTYSRSQPSLNGQGHQHQQQSSKQQQHKQTSEPCPRSSTPILKTPSLIDGKLNGTPVKREGQLYVSKSTQTSAPEISSIDPNNDGQICKKRAPQGSWSLLGVPEEKVIYLRDDEPPKRLICYPAIKHVEGDVIQVRDSVLLRSGAKKTDLPYIAKVCAFWEDAETGSVMMSLFWYYRPEHTEEGRKSHHLPDEIFASRHRDVDSVECIEDKCYVLTFNEYCRYKKRCKMEQVSTTWSLADVTIPVSNESYPRRNRIPDVNVNPELVFCCRQIYDSRMRRLIKNPLINTKYGHI